MANRYYSAIALDTTLSSSITNTSTTMVVGGTVGYPTQFPFVLAVDYNAATEELVLVTAVAGTTLTITRGYNGTTPQAHSTGAVVRHVIVAQDLTDAQNHYATTLPSGAHGVTGSLATFLATPSSANLASVVTDETGTGPLVFNQSPTIANPTLTGTVTAGGSTGSSGQVLTSSGSGIAWATPISGNLTINAQTASYTIQASDVNALVTISSSSATTVTVPPSVFTAGQQINVQGIGTGAVTFAAGSGVTINGTGTALRAQYSGATLVCTATNTFSLFGDIQ